MTRTHFEAVAQIIKQRFDMHDRLRARRGHDGDYQVGYDAGFIAGVEGMSLALADYFEGTNELFDRERFLDACGL